VLHRKGDKRLGLLGMRERLEMVGGRFEVESTSGRGTTIIAQIPSGKAACAEDH
jgi:signal transduction histidine kinase